MGSKIEWGFQSYNNGGGTPTGIHTTAQMDVVGTNLFGSSTDYKYDFKAMGDSALKTILTLNGDGDVVLPQYIGTSLDVSNPLGYKTLIVDNSGNVRKYSGGVISTFDLGYTPAPNQGTVTNSTGGNTAILPVVTTTNAGLMAPSMLNLLSASSYIVNGQTGVATKNDSIVWFANDSTYIFKQVHLIAGSGVTI